MATVNVNVNVAPMPAWARKIPARLRPVHPPIFEGDPAPTDVELARALFRELDRDSQDWYRGARVFADL